MNGRATGSAHPWPCHSLLFALMAMMGAMQAGHQRPSLVNRGKSPRTLTANLGVLQQCGSISVVVDRRGVIEVPTARNVT